MPCTLPEEDAISTHGKRSALMCFVAWGEIVGVAPVALVEIAAKCFWTAAASSSLSTSHVFAELAFSIVSCVVKVLEHTRKRVVSALTFLSVSAMCVPSTLLTKCTAGPSA